MKLSKQTIIVSVTIMALLISCGVNYAYNTPNALLARGNKYLLVSNYSDAIVTFQKVIAKDEKSIPALMGLQQSYVYTGNSSQAEAILKEVLQIDPKNITAQEALFHVYLKELAIDKAQPLLKLLNNDPELLTEWRAVQDIVHSKSNYDDGIKAMNEKTYDTAIEKFKMVIMEDTDRYKTAQTKIEESVIFRTNFLIQEARGSASKSNYREAISWLQRLLDGDPSNQEALSLKSEYESKIMWEPIFDPVMVSISTQLYDGNINAIYGKIKNYTNTNWYSVTLVFTLFDANNKVIGNAVANVVQTIQPNKIADFKTENGWVSSGVKRFQLIKVSPMTVKL